MRRETIYRRGILSKDPATRAYSSANPLNRARTSEETEANRNSAA
jgi:hypothetical protein